MGPKKNLTNAEKLEEIRQMQQSWMKQRAIQSGEDRGTTHQHRQGQGKDHRGQNNKTSSKINKATKDEGTISWVVSGGQSKKTRSLRARSASPSKNSTTENKSHLSRPNSSRNKPRSNPASSRGSRPPSGQSVVNSPVSPGRGKSGVSSPSSHKTGIQSISKTRGHGTRIDTSSHGGESGSLLDRSLSESDLTEALHATIQKPTCSDNNLTDRTRVGKVPIDQSQMSNRESSQSATVMAGGLLDPSQFHSLAERLSQKVRGHILEEEKKAFMGRGCNQDSILLEEPAQSNSHACPKCKQMMIPPDHAPTLLIPCGHTLCEPCAEDRIKCPTCRTKVTSTALNESLLRIITTSASRTLEGRAEDRPHREETTQPTNHEIKPEQPSQGKAYNPLDFTGSRNHKLRNQKLNNNEPNNNTGSSREQNGFNSRTTSELPLSRHYEIHSSEFHSTFAPLKGYGDPAEQAERYAEEYESLSIRCEAYENEETMILERVERKTQEIQKQKMQIMNINREQQRIREEIESLQEKLSVLTSHEEEFNKQCDALEEIKQGDLEQLKSVRNTKKGIEKQRDKIKFLGRGIGLSLD